MPACGYVEEIGIAAIHAGGYRLINIREYIAKSDCQAGGLPFKS